MRQEPARPWGPPRPVRASPLPCPVAMRPRQGRLPQVSNGSAGITVDACDFENSPRPRPTRVQSGSDPGAASSHPRPAWGLCPKIQGLGLPARLCLPPGPPLPVVSVGRPSRAGPAPLRVSGNGHSGVPWGEPLLSPRPCASRGLTVPLPRGWTPRPPWVCLDPATQDADPVSPHFVSQMVSFCLTCFELSSVPL